jgi:hypothetical protein
MSTIAERRNFLEGGFVVLSLVDSPFTKKEWARVRELAFADDVSFEHVTSGDTNEPTSILVNRLLLDGNPPFAPDEAKAEELIRIIGSPAKLDFLEQLVGRTNLMVRRVQAHIMEQGGHIGRHQDSESSEHYVAAVILQFDRAEEGGDFLVYCDGQDTKMPPFSMLVMDAEIPHEVARITRGERRTLAFWLADASSP